MQRLVFIVVVLVGLGLCSFKIMAQDKDDALNAYQRVEGSYIFGTQVYNDVFLYNPGVSLTFSYGASINKYASVGLGSGFQSFDEEKFIPFYIDVMGFQKGKKNVPYLNMQVGYSIGWANSITGIETYEYKGGIYVNAGVGRKIALNDNLSLMIQCAYRHQSAQMRYAAFDAKDYNQNLNYDMLVITLGIMALNK